MVFTGTDYREHVPEQQRRYLHACVQIAQENQVAEQAVTADVPARGALVWLLVTASGRR